MVCLGNIIELCQPGSWSSRKTSNLALTTLPAAYASKSGPAYVLEPSLHDIAIGLRNEWTCLIRMTVVLTPKVAENERDQPWLLSDTGIAVRYMRSKLLCEHAGLTQASGVQLPFVHYLNIHVSNANVTQDVCWAQSGAAAYAPVSCSVG